MKYLSKLIISFAFLLLSTTLLADTPVGPMNYQGRLLDNNGIPVTGTYNFSASVYDAVSGGTLKYRELHNSVAVDDGVYAFLVGTTPKDAGDSTWSVELWNCCSNLYLEIAVNGETLSPRHQLAAAPYAFQANLALTTNNALALGGKTAAQYNNILADICASSKGKWLELAGKCLGIGASFPGPTQVSWNTLTASSNFSNLDLSRADISGIDFNGANLSSTIFNKTTYAAKSMSAANLSYTQWNSAVSTDSSPYTLLSSTNLSNATFQNMDMSKWGMGSISQTNMEGLSAAYISACPPNFTTWWECRLMRASASNYFFVGPGVNLAAGSAATTVKFGVSYLDVDKNALASARLDHASLVGVTLTQDFVDTYLYTADMSYTTIINSSFKNAWCAGTKFVNSHIENTTFASDVFMPSQDFTDAHLSYVRFDNTVSNVIFTRAVLNQVDFTTLGGPNFTNAILEGVRINTQLYGAAPGTIPTFDKTRFYGGFYVADINDGDVTTMVFKDLSFIGGTLSGDFTNVTFTGSILFKDITFSHLDLCSAVVPYVDTTAPIDDFKTVVWSGPVECPNGLDATGGTSYCQTVANWTETAAANCTAGVP